MALVYDPSTGNFIEPKPVVRTPALPVNAPSSGGDDKKKTGAAKSTNAVAAPVQQKTGVFDPSMGFIRPMPVQNLVPYQYNNPVMFSTKNITPNTGIQFVPPRVGTITTPRNGVMFMSKKDVPNPELTYRGLPGRNAVFSMQMPTIANNPVGAPQAVTTAPINTSKPATSQPPMRTVNAAPVAKPLTSKLNEFEFNNMIPAGKDASGKTVYVNKNMNVPGNSNVGVALAKSGYSMNASGGLTDVRAPGYNGGFNPTSGKQAPNRAEGYSLEEIANSNAKAGGTGYVWGSDAPASMTTQFDYINGRMQGYNPYYNPATGNAPKVSGYYFWNGRYYPINTGVLKQYNSSGYGGGGWGWGGGSGGGNWWEKMTNWTIGE